MRIIILLGLLFSASASADDPIWLPNIPGDATGTQTGAHNGLDVNVLNPTASPIPVSLPSPMAVVIQSPLPLPVTIISPIPYPSPFSTVTANQGAPGPASSPWPVYMVSPLPQGIPSPIPSQFVNINLNGNLIDVTGIGASDTNFSPPSNATCVYIEASSSNISNLRWAVGVGVATPSSGLRLEPGRSTDGCIPVNDSVGVASESASSQEVMLQWVQQY